MLWTTSEVSNEPKINSPRTLLCMQYLRESALIRQVSTVLEFVLKDVSQFAMTSNIASRIKKMLHERRSQKSAVMKFRVSERQQCGGFLVSNSALFHGEVGLNLVTGNFTTFFTTRRQKLSPGTPAHLRTTFALRDTWGSVCVCVCLPSLYFLQAPSSHNAF